MPRIACTLWVTMVGITPGFAEKRVALVIGNSNDQHVGRLPNPVNDAAAIAIRLRSAGFAVVELRSDIRPVQMRRAISDFAETTRDSDIAVIYFAGHGIEVDGTNYLIPVDAVLARDFDVEDETVSLDCALRAIEPARRLRLVILASCRNDPFTESIKRSTRATGRGLARVEPATPSGSARLRTARLGQPEIAVAASSAGVPGSSILGTSARAPASGAIRRRARPSCCRPRC